LFSLKVATTGLMRRIIGLITAYYAVIKQVRRIATTKQEKA
jgi:hypothetical protein